MTLPASGTLGLSTVNTEIGAASTASISLSWIKTNTKDNVGSISNLYSRAWYQKNNAGNCSNGNCPTNCNCGGGIRSSGIFTRYWTPIQCNNCLACTGVNCVNCDAKAWLQANCNCACTYNCNITASTTYNCNCDCDCACDCNCACCK